MATDSASCEPDLSRAPGDTEGATAEAAVTEFPRRWEPCRRGLGVVPWSPLDTPLGVPGPFLGCLVFLWGAPYFPVVFLPKGFPSFSGISPFSCASSLDYPFLSRGVPFVCPFPGVSPGPEAGSSGGRQPPTPEC